MSCLPHLRPNSTPSRPQISSRLISSKLLHRPFRTPIEHEIQKRNYFCIERFCVAFHMKQVLLNVREFCQGLKAARPSPIRATRASVGPLRLQACSRSVTGEGHIKPTNHPGFKFKLCWYVFHDDCGFSTDEKRFQMSGCSI
jgi:hypothetical protein